MKPRLLDLFCGAGGAAMGYHRAGFDVVGVDIRPQPNYPFRFVQDDALRYLDYCGLDGFDAIHASPPCQAFTTMSNGHRGKGGVADSRTNLIPETRKLSEATGLPYVIENVPGSKWELRNSVVLTGEKFGLRVWRPRLFESNWFLMVPPPARKQRDPVAIYGAGEDRRLWTRLDGSELRSATLESGSEAMGIDCWRPGGCHNSVCSARRTHDPAACAAVARMDAPPTPHQETRTMTVYYDTTENLHPYECNGQGKCRHCDRAETDDHDPATCALCDPDYDFMPNPHRPTLAPAGDNP